jgi:hypothetical protein
MAELAELIEMPNKPLQPTGMNISAYREHSAPAAEGRR